MTRDALKFLDDPAGLDAAGGKALPLYSVRPDEWADTLPGLPAAVVTQASLLGFTGEEGRILLIPDEQGAVAGAVLGLGSRSIFSGFGSAAAVLPAASVWQIQAGKFSMEEAELGFLLGSYRYQTQRARKTSFASLATASARSQTVAGSIMLARELINTPANLLGPSELAEAAMHIAARFGAEAECVRGEALAARFPTIHAVGAGSDRAPAAVAFRWRGSSRGCERTIDITMR